MQKPFQHLAIASLALASLLAGCAEDPDSDSPDSAESTSSAVTTTSAIQTVFIIMMENNSASTIYGNATDCPYINGTLMKSYAYATNYVDTLASSIPSEPHYIQIEAGTNAFSDHTFTTDAVPSTSNDTKSTAHLVTRLHAKGITWRSYQEGLSSTSGLCPLANDSSTSYAVRHQPFTFFWDVSGLSKTNSYCESHTKPYSSLAADLANNTVAQYNFITPDLCHDMHVQGCAQRPSQSASTARKNGDLWLKNNLPAIINYVTANHGLLVIAWDEPEGSSYVPFLVISPDVKSAGYKNSVKYTHASLTRSFEEIFQIDPTHGGTWLGAAGANNDLSDFFQSGTYP